MNENRDSFTTIEINGIKMEVDLRHARRVETFRIGTRVKLLRRKGPYTAEKVFPGVIVGFEPFPDRPTILVAYLDTDYGSTKVELAHINDVEEADTKWQMVPAVDDELPFDKAHVVAHLDSVVLKAQADLEDAMRKRDYFLAHFGRWFEPLAGVKVEG